MAVGEADARCETDETQGCAAAASMRLVQH